MPSQRKSATTARLKRKPGIYSALSPPRRHQRKPSITPTTGLRLYQKRHCCGHDGAGKSDGRDVKAELDDERDDIAEVAIFDVERGDQQRRAEAREHGEHDEDGQQHDLPTRRKAVPDHQHKEHREVDRKIDQRHDRGRGRNDDAREIDLTDRLALPTKLFEASLKIVENRNHGSMPAKTMIG